MKITFDLSDRDIQHFKRISKNAKALAKGASENEVISATEKLLDKVSSKTPDFIGERLDRLRSLIAMLRDTEWGIAGTERDRVLAALAYFCDPEDVIPDATPGFGFLDDAIMVELITTELKHEIEAYDDFRNYRDREKKRTGADASRAEWLKNRRRELFERMRRRNRRDRADNRVRIRLF
ncbi:MAG TPA: YkvA family protein [Gammaproteobacteria bacterium]